MDTRKKLHNLFIALSASTLSAVCTNFLSFVSPSWIQSIPDRNTQFVRIGLWTACFNGYMRPDDFNKAYFGCYYIYFVEYDRIRSWINPVWLYCIQVMSSAGMLMHSLVAFVVLCQVTKTIDRNNLIMTKFIIFGHFFTCVTLAASLVAFAVARYDSKWMPYPQTNVLSWSYAVAVLSFCLTLLSFILGFGRYLYIDASFKDHEKTLLEGQKGLTEQEAVVNYPLLQSENEYPQYFNEQHHAGEPFNDAISDHSESDETNAFNGTSRGYTSHPSNGYFN